MLRLFMPIAAAAALVGAALPAAAADIYEPPVIETPPPEVVYRDTSYGGWYIRGDIDFHKSKIKEIEFITYGADVDCCGDPVAIPGTGSFNSAALRGAMSLGAGVGYQISDHFRADLTADYWFKSKFNGSTPGPTTNSTDTSAYQALLLLANAYVDLGTYHRITPYVGAGIGGAYIKWDELRNQFPGVDDRHRGAKGMRFAWAVMAGASYCLTNRLSADVGYRYSRISGGRMFEYVDSSAGGPGAGPGFHSAIGTHEVRGGLRYSFSDNNCAPTEVAYEPEPISVPIYK